MRKLPFRIKCLSHSFFISFIPSKSFLPCFLLFFLSCFLILLHNISSIYVLPSSTTFPSSLLCPSPFLYLFPLLFLHIFSLTYQLPLYLLMPSHLHLHFYLCLYDSTHIHKQTDAPFITHLFSLQTLPLSPVPPSNKTLNFPKANKRTHFPPPLPLSLFPLCTQTLPLYHPHLFSPIILLFLLLSLQTSLHPPHLFSPICIPLTPAMIQNSPFPQPFFPFSCVFSPFILSFHTCHYSLPLLSTPVIARTSPPLPKLFFPFTRLF